MAETVTAFPGVALPDQAANEQPVAEVVEALEQMLAKAKTGYLRALAFSYVRPGHRTSYGWLGIKHDLAAMNALHSGMTTCWTALGVLIDQTSSEADPTDPETDEC